MLFKLQMCFTFQVFHVGKCWKVNLVGALKGQNLKFSIVFLSAGKNKTKIKEKVVATTLSGTLIF